MPLEALLRATPDAFLRARVLAYDEITGSRKFFESGKYRLDDIVRGKYDGLEVVRSRVEG